uniref:NADH-ubiquinone oxidoreductase chain 6 n=1 Tax=Norvellina sp. EMHAU-15062816 TaxID=2040462 RepID=A0A343KGM2_9HEMI|nr:NADH dehydrogenase subunit 6 [Norvellina sp. EMHAU-15062816]
MKILLIKMMMLIASIINMMKTPMSMGILLLSQTFMLTLLISKMMENSWMAMIIFLMFIGGLLILFTYMSSIASNEKFKPNFMLMLVLILVSLPLEEMIMEIQIHELSQFYSNKETITLTKIYNKKTMMITVMMFMYMLLSMIVVTKIVKTYKGPLRSMTYE